jgi:hypothetical protein
VRGGIVSWFNMCYSVCHLMDSKKIKQYRCCTYLIERGAAEEVLTALRQWI